MHKKLISILALFATSLIAQAADPLDFKFAPSDGSKATTLRALMGDKRAVLLDFWASWCGPCRRAMPHLIETAHKLSGTIVVVGVNTESVQKAEEIKVSLNKIQEEKKAPTITFPWVYDSESLFSKLAIQWIPRWVLINTKGEILFNDHPDKTEAFEAALKKI